MSMIRCDLCDRMVDSDYYPEGFYIKGHEDKYICKPCVFKNELEEI